MGLPTALAELLGITNAEADSVEEVVEELKRGREKFGKYRSRHEAYAIVKEELDELCEEIKANRTEGDYEAVQVAATALRYVMEFVNLPRE